MAWRRQNSRRRRWDPSATAPQDNWLADSPYDVEQEDWDSMSTEEKRDYLKNEYEDPISGQVGFELPTGTAGNSFNRQFGSSMASRYGVPGPNTFTPPPVAYGPSAGGSPFPGMPAPSSFGFGSGGGGSPMAPPSGYQNMAPSGVQVPNIGSPESTPRRSGGDDDGGFLGSVGGALSDIGGGVEDFFEWDEMSGPEKIYTLTQGLGTAANIYGAYKAGQQRDREFDIAEEERRRRHETEETLNPVRAAILRQLFASGNGGG